METEFKITKIAVPVDFSDTSNVAVNHAVDIAKRFDAELVLIHVLETGAYQGIFAPSTKTEFGELETAQQKLQEDSRELEQKTGLRVAHFVMSGRIYEEIVNLAKNQKADLIVMGTHGTSGWAEFFAGSNAFRVVTQCPCPVLTIQENASEDELKNIILPLDSTSESRQKVKHAVAFAKKFGSTIHIVSLLSEDTPEWRYDFEKKVKQITDYLEREGIPHTETVETGSNLATMTMDFAEAKGGNLIVMMTEQEPNVTGFLVGPFAQQIVNHSKIPVLSVSPEDLFDMDDSFHALG